MKCIWEAERLRQDFDDVVNLDGFLEYLVVAVHVS